MPTVAELDVQVDAKDNATATLAEIDALIKAMEGDDVTIDVDAAAEDAIAELRLVDEMLDAINGRHEVDVEVNSDVGEAMAEVEALDAALEGIEDETVTIEVEADAAGEIAALEAELAAIPDETVTIEVDKDRASAGIQELAAQARGASSSLGAITTAALALGPALVPLLATATVATVGLGAGFIGAGLGAGLFGAVAVSAFSQVADANKELTTLQEQYNQAVTDDQKQKALEKMKAVMESLSPAQQEMVREVQNFSAVWRDFVADFQPQVFELATVGLRGISGLLPTMAPIVQSVADALLRLENAAFRALAGPFWQSFFAMLGSTAGPALESTVRIIGNLIRFIAGLMMAFQPMATSMLGGLERLTAGWADWAASLSGSSGFQEFMDYIRATLPQVGEFLGAFGRALVDLVQAAAPVGAAILAIATKLFEMWSALQNAHPELASLILIIVGLAAVILNVIGPIASIVAGFIAIGGTASLIIGAVLAVIAVFIAALLHFEGFRNAVFATASAVASFAGMVWGAVQRVGQAIWTVLQPAFAAIGQFVGEEVAKAKAWVQSMMPTFQAAWQNISTGIMAFAGVVRAIWNALWPVLSTVVQAAWAVISTTISVALSIIRTIIEVVLRVIAGDWSGLWNMLPGVVQTALSFIGGIVQTGISVISAIISTALAIIRGIWTVFWAVFGGPISAAFAIVSALVSAAFAVISALFSAAVAILRPIWSAFWNGVQIVVGAAVGVIVGVIRTWWAVTTAVWTAAIGVLRAAWSAFWNVIQTVVRTITGAVQGTIGGWVGNLISTIVGFITNIVGRWNAFWSNLSANTTAAINTIRSFITSGVSNIASTISSFISNIISRFSSGFSTIVSTVTSAMSRFASAISSGVSRAISAITGFASRAVGVVRGLAGQFFSAGANIISSLINGIKSRVGAVVGAIGDVVGKIRGALPFSPAKWGPLSGSGYPLYAGQKIAQSVADGIADRTSAVAASMRDLSDLALLDTNSAAAFEAITGTRSGAGGGGGITIVVEPGAIVVQVGDGVDPAEARAAFDDAGDDLADKILTAARRR